MGKTVEIERRWTIDRFPDDLELVRDELIDQSYISLDPEVRIRKIVDLTDNGMRVAYRLTIKGTGTMKRVEVETSIMADEYGALATLTPHAPIKKIRKKYRLNNGLYVECNIVEPGTEDQLMYAEIEFPDEETANVYVPDSFLGEEHTNIPGYKMQDVWKRIRIDRAAKEN